LAPGLRLGPHEVVLNGARLFYRVGGPADVATPPVVFLHGGPGQGSEHFDGLAGPFMERDLRMVYFDQRGAGASERPASGDYSLTTMLEDIAALQRELGVPKLALIGHSFGAVLALEYAAKYPEHVSHVIIVDGLWDTSLQCRLRLQVFAAQRPETYARVRGDSIRADGTKRNDCDLELRGRGMLGAERHQYEIEAMFPDPSVAARMDSVSNARNARNTGEASNALLSSLNRYRFTAFARLSMPVLVVAGRLDHWGAMSASLRELARLLPDSRFVEFKQSGHFPYLDEPDRFAKVVSAFIRTR
jgi:proline iminopeptidase